MKSRSGRRCAEEAIPFADHPPHPGLDAPVADPRRIAGHDIESAAGHHVCEVDVEGEEINFAVFDSLQGAARHGQTLLEGANAFEVFLDGVAKEVTTGRHRRLHLAFIGLDGAREEIGSQAAIVRPQQTVQRRALFARRGAVTLDEIVLRANAPRPVAIDVGAR